MSPWTSLITVLTLLLYWLCKVMPPEMRENRKEEVVRVQNNTLEQIVFFLPGLWLFSFYVNPLWGAIIGTVWLIGLILILHYACGYYLSDKEEMMGLVINCMSSIVLLLGSLIGIILTLVRS